MSGIYKCLGGETFSMVARATCGDDTLAAVIMAANPTAFEPFAIGTILQIPKMPKPEAGLDGDELEIVIDPGHKMGTLDDFELILSIDAMAKGSFTVPNERETRAIFAPLSNPGIIVGFSGVLQHTGYCVSPTPSGRLMNVDFESTCALIEEINAPVSAYPLEFKDLNFQQIAEHLCNPLGLSVIFSNPPGTRFSRVDIEQETKLLDFLSQLAKQRNFVSTSNEKGELVMWREVEPGSPVARFDANQFPVYGDPGVVINEKEYYSSITGKVAADPKKGKKARNFTVKNPFAGVLSKPYNFSADDIDDGELETCVNTVAGRMFGGVYSILINVASWRDGAGDIWKPNTTIEYRDEENFVNDYYEFVISEIKFTKTATEKNAILKLTLPGCYGGKFPIGLPWQK